MPTEQDKEDASLPWDGEAQKILLYRHRFDRDGLFPFGRRDRPQTVILTPDDLRGPDAGWVLLDLRGSASL
jgi:hypothetical protein